MVLVLLTSFHAFYILKKYNDSTFSKIKMFDTAVSSIFYLISKFSISIL